MYAMNTNCITVGSFDAKTHFAELLRKVAEGVIVEITKNGKKVAVLQSPEKISQTDAQEAAQRIEARRVLIEQRRIRQGMEPVTQKMIKEWKEYGRKY